MSTPQNEETPDTVNGPGRGIGEMHEADSAALPQVLPAIRSQRQRRTLVALLDGPRTREQLDRLAGASNSPDVVLTLRRRFGLALPCALETVLDRDGKSVERGVYRLAELDKPTALRLVQASASTGKGGHVMSTAYKNKNKDFPTPVKLGARCTRWKAGEVRAWLQAQGVAK